MTRPQRDATGPLADARLAEVEQFLDVWDVAPAHRAQYRDVISSQKSGDPEGGRKLRATTLRDLLAEVRRLRGEAAAHRLQQSVISPRYALTYGHDELNLWCDPCADIDAKPLGTWYGGPDRLAEVVAAAARHDADHAADAGTGAGR